MSNNQELVMETTHGRSKKCKTEFKAVLNKVLVSGLVLATMLGTATTAFAAEIPKDNLNAYATSVAYNQGISVESVLDEIRNTISTIKGMMENGNVSDSKLSELATQLYNLEKAVKSSGGSVNDDVVKVVLEAEGLASKFNSSGGIKAQGAVAIVKDSLGIDSVTVENKESPAPSFEDVPTTYWAYNNITILAQKNIVSGVGNNKFNPSGTVTLGQFLAIATRLVANDSIVANTDSNHWALPNYNAAVKTGLISQYDFSIENLNDVISREDMAYILVQVAKANGETLKIIEGIESNISDFDDISQSRQNYVLQAYSNGLLAGKGNGQFDPKGNATRAEISTVFCRVMNYIDRDTVTVKPETPSEVSLVNKNGQMSYEYASKYILDSMNTARVYKENGKYYISCTLADLPEGFYWQPGATVYHDDNGYLFYTVDRDWVKSTGTIKIELEGVTSITDIAPVSFSLRIRTKENASGSVSYNVLSSYMGKIHESRNDGGKTQWVDYDTSAIFAGIK